jgi:predicted oxidoreductase (fatty acid repression mutant protein)
MAAPGCTGFASSGQPPSFLSRSLLHKARIMTNAVVQALKTRRTQYALGKTLPLPKAEVAQLIQDAIKQSPSAFNSQSSRAVILFGADSDKFWGLVLTALRQVVPAENFGPTEAKIKGFAAGAGTVLFYEDQNVVKGLQEKFAAYAQNFPIWSEQASGMAQLAVWTALAAANIGASLQHYNPLVDDAAAAQWNTPASWKLRAMMPFGSNQAGFGDKAFMNDAERFRVFG